MKKILFAALLLSSIHCFGFNNPYVVPKGIVETLFDATSNGDFPAYTYNPTATNEIDDTLFNWVAGKFNTPTGTTNQYIAGDGSLHTLPVGINGANGSKGDTGTNSYVTFAPAVTLPYLTSAYASNVVSVTTTGIVNTVTLGIPQGGPGTMGSTGATGPTGAAGADGALSIQRIHGTTSSSGLYTWTFPTAFTSVPRIIVTPYAASGTLANIQIVSVTTSNAVFQSYNLPSISVVGILVLGSPTTPATPFDAWAISQ